MLVRQWMSSVVLLAGLLTGCPHTSPGAGGGSDAGFAAGGAGAGDGGSTDALSGYRAMATADCGWMARCGLIASAQVADCATGLLRHYTGQYLLPQYSSFAVSGVEACVSAFDSRSCTDPFWYYDLPQECFALGAKATVKTGETCAFSPYECASPLDSCTGTTCPRTCQTVPQGANGQPCRRGEAESQCDSGLFCNGQFVCEPKKPVGASCRDRWDASSECLSGECGAIGSDGVGTCAVLPGAGLACSASGSCTEGTFCGSNFVCAPKRGVGEVCDPARGNQCARPLWCGGGICRQPGHIGSACAGSSECASPTRCDAILRSCQALTEVPAGGQCTGGSRDCEPGVKCVGERTQPDGGVGSLGVCTVPTPGSPCDGSDECPDRTFCDATRRCAPAVTGSPCARSGNCQTADYCGSTRTCAPRFASGALCEEGYEGATCLVATERCVSGATDAVARCRPLGGVGAACGSILGCQPFLPCMNGRCREAGHLGQPCYFPEEAGCFEGACVDGVCVGPLPAGRRCTDFKDCDSEICIDGACRAAACE